MGSVLVRRNRVEGIDCFSLWAIMADQLLTSQSSNCTRKITIFVSRRVIRGNDPGEDRIVGWIEIASACIFVDEIEVPEVTDVVVPPLQRKIFNNCLRRVVEFLCIKGYLVEFQQDSLVWLLRLFVLKKMKEVILVIVDEVEDNRCTVLKFYEQALSQSQVSSLQHANDLHQRPKLFNRLVLSQYKRGKLQMRILLVSRQILEPK